VTNDEQWLHGIGVVATADPDDPAGDHAEDADDEHDTGEGAPDAIHSQPDHDDVVDLDADPNPPDDPADSASTPRRFTPWVAAVFVSVAVVATVATIGVSALSSRDTPAAPPRPTAIAHPPVAVAQPPPASPQTADAPIPFTASADCPAGSTAAQSVADPSSPTPWICVRSVDGQVLTIDLGRAYVLTAISIVPGAVTAAGGNDQGDPWLQHRVVTRVQWQFNDTDNTILKQATGDVHGEAVLTVPHLLASRITMIVQETSRPPMVAPTATPTPDPAGGVLGPILGAPSTAPGPSPAQLPGEPQPPDPSDGTFAVTSIKVIGHRAI
jgi:hypothetical protein